VAPSGEWKWKVTYDKLTKNFWKSYETLRKVSKINLGKSYEDKQKKQNKNNVQNITFDLVIGRGSNSRPLVSCHFSCDGVLSTLNIFWHVRRPSDMHGVWSRGSKTKRKTWREVVKEDSRLTNYELLRWLVETPSRDIEHYRMTDDSRSRSREVVWHVEKCQTDFYMVDVNICLVVN